MSRRTRRRLRFAAPIFGALLALLGTLPDLLSAQEPGAALAQDCPDRVRWNRYSHCEVRDYTLAASRDLSVDASPNGGIRVEAWDRNQIRVVARVQATAPTQDEAERIAEQVRIETSGGTVRALGPDTRDNRGWSVSYEISVPQDIDLELESVNGGISVTGVRGDLVAGTTNGGITLTGVEGSVRGASTNGGVTVRLAGNRWAGDRLDLSTTNGGITLAVPESFSAHLVATTVHGSLDTGFAIPVQGRISRRIEGDIGGGGPTVRLSTTNGGIRIQRN